MINGHALSPRLPSWARSLPTCNRRPRLLAVVARHDHGTPEAVTDSAPTGSHQELPETANPITRCDCARGLRHSRSRRSERTGFVARAHGKCAELANLRVAGGRYAARSRWPESRCR